MDTARRPTRATPSRVAAELTAVPLGRALGLLYVTGGSVALLWTLLPHRPDGGDLVVTAMAGLALLLGTTLFTTAHRLPTGLLHAALVVIQVVIGVAYLAEGEPSCDIRLFFLWATPYAALYFGVRAALGHLAWTATVLVACLLLMPAATRSDAGDVALMLLGTLVATGVLVANAAGALRSAEGAQRHAATHDPLTGLANRRRLLDVLQEVQRPGSATTGEHSALVLLDLDGFKSVNDRYGHAEGDALLKAVAARLLEVVRSEDLVCRLGGDEFALVVHGQPDEADAVALAARAAAAIASVRPAGVGHLSVRASAGVRLLVPRDLDTSTALRDADAALYVSKRAGLAVPHLWTSGLRSDAADQLELAEDLRQALAEGQLRLVYQPVVDVLSLRVHGLEALARWRHPVRGDVGPDHFVPCAERAGLARELTRWVLRTAFTEAAAWPADADGVRIKLAVNISAVQLTDLSVVDDVRQALAAAGLAAGDVVLEVTETAAVVDLPSARRTLDALAAVGVRLALDDFGTGYSSLTHVQALPFHILKVDRSFVSASARGDRRSTATVAAVGALAAQLDVDVVAEGVEDHAELAALLALGCGHAQGFGLSRPMEAPAVAAALAASGADGWVLLPARPVVRA